MKLAPLLLLMMIIAGCSDRTPPEPEAQSIRPAKLMTVQTETSKSLFEFTARIDALQTIDLSFEVGGPLDQFPVREGALVEKGSLIAALDPKQFQLAVKEAEVQVKLASQDLNRKRKVLKENGIAKSQVEDAQSNYELQRVRHSRAKEQLDDARIIAPFDAYVSERYFDEHVNVSPGQPIVKLHDLTQLLVLISIPENLVATVDADQLIRAWVEFSFVPDQQFDITFHEIRGEADSLAQTYELSFTMENPEDLNLLPGMTGTAQVQLKSSDTGVLLLPSSALSPTTDGKLSVWVFDPETTLVHRRMITTGAPTQDGVPVLAGLTSGEQIVVAGAHQLQEGMQVRPL